MNRKKTADKISLLYIICGAALWGFMGLFVRSINHIGFSSFDICFFRSIGTAAFLFVFLLIFNTNAFKIKLKDIGCFIGSGLISIVFFNYCYFTTITKTSLSIAAVLLYTSPAFVIVLSAIIFKERITLSRFVAVLLAIAGCVCVSGIFGETTNSLSYPTLLVGIGAGLGYALYSIFSRIAINKGYSTMTITFYTFLIASVGTIPFLSTLNLPGQIANNPDCIVPILGLILVATILPYMFYTTGLKNTTNTTASILACIEPVVATILGVLLFNEALTIPNFIGIVLILGASVLIAL